MYTKDYFEDQCAACLWVDLLRLVYTFPEDGIGDSINGLDRGPVGCCVLRIVIPVKNAE